MNIYKQAIIEKIRFNSSRGLLTVEQLLDLPLNSETKVNLNDIAREVSASIVVIEDFVNGMTNDNSVEELKLEIVKDIIADRLQENKDELEREETLNQIARLEGIKEIKADKALGKMSNKELDKELIRLRSK